MESLRVGEWFALAVGLTVYGSMVLAAAAILKKAGYSRWWSIVAIVPIANWVALIVFACSEWPALKRSSDRAAWVVGQFENRPSRPLPDRPLD